MDAYNAERNEITRTSAADSLAIIDKMNAGGSVDFKRLSDEAAKNTAEQNKKIAALNEKYR